LEKGTEATSLLVVRRAEKKGDVDMIRQDTLSKNGGILTENELFYGRRQKLRGLERSY